MHSSTRLSDAEDLALRTLWHTNGFVDSRSAAFHRRSRFYQWRVNVAIILALCWVSVCWLAPDWLAGQLKIHGHEREWFTLYLLARGAVAACWLVVGLYWWRTQRNVLTFWACFTVYACAIWALDYGVLSSPELSDGPYPYALIWPLRLGFVCLGIANIWRHYFAPLKGQRQVLAWPLARATAS